MKFLALCALMLFSLSSMASIVKSLDEKNQCTLYRSTKTEEEIQKNEIVVLKKATYGISLVDLKIDFQNEQVSMVPMVNVIMGFDKPLIGKAVTLDSTNENFNALVNQLNKTLFLLDRICIDRDDKLIYATIQTNK